MATRTEPASRLGRVRGWLARLWPAWATHSPRVDSLASLDPTRTRLILGLGNPGEKYAATRHNVGFMAVDALATRHDAAWQDRARDLAALIAVIPARDEAPSLVLAKPVTFMNRSGEALSRLLNLINGDPASALVIYDDMDLPFGTLRLRQRGSAGTHNGMRSVVREVATDVIPRLRMGISQPPGSPAIDHVLGTFEPQDQETLEAMVARAADAAQDWAIHGPAVAMNRYNKG